MQVLVLKFVSLVLRNSEAAAGQSFSQAHYCFLCDCRVGGNLWMANCAIVGKAEIPLLGSLRWHPSATAVWAGIGFDQCTGALDGGFHLLPLL